jgi:hypothetical protein
LQGAYAQTSNGKYLPVWAREKLSISKFLFWAASALAATTAITISHIYSIGLILKI